jgi:hypothetical protein
VRWEQGRGEIERLLDDGELQRVVADVDAAAQMVQAAGRHLDSARKVRDDGPEGAYAVLYDAARKACAALLETQGLRATSRGGF